MADTPRVFKPETPRKLIVAVTLLGILLVAFVVYATWTSSRQIEDARKRGTIVGKQFIPFPEQQIVVGKAGLQSFNKKGNFTITVRVNQKDGSTKDYIVENLDEKRYEALKEGDQFDVGPYLVP